MATEFNHTLSKDIDIDGEAVVDAVIAAADVLVFEDSYGTGVALVEGVPYQTYHDLAEEHGLDILNYLS